MSIATELLEAAANVRHRFPAALPCPPSETAAPLKAKSAEAAK